jgi:IclR family KDG regulon transcriptional repressor
VGGETFVALGILECTEESSKTIRMISYVGKRAPLYCTALGKVLLAHLPLVGRNILLNNITISKLPRTHITNKKKLEEELNTI